MLLARRRRSLPGILLAAATFVPAFVPAIAAGAADEPPTPFSPTLIDDAPPAPVERARHEGVFNGERIEYQTVTAEFVLDDADGKPSATMFSTGYVRTDAGGAGSRPVLFLWNGGPGASSSPLHLGIGPVRRPAEGEVTTLVANGLSPLDATDMVFVDPVGTGYSRLFEEGAGKRFWGINEDADAVLAFIRHWLEREGRTDAPVYVFGESYGGTRVAALLARAGDLDFAGALLLSPALDYSAGTAVTGNNLPYVFQLPSLAVTAAYHGRTDTGGASFRDRFEEAAAFAQSDYAGALNRGSALPASRRDATVTELESLLGLPADVIREHDLRVDYGAFRDSLLADRELRVGRLDARVTGPVADFDGKRPPYNDPSMSGGPGDDGPSTGELLADYFRDRLNTDVDRHYRTLNLDANSKWNFKQTEGHQFYYSVVPQLEGAMQASPGMRLYVGGGLFDLATPVLAARYSIGQMRVDPARVTFAAYDAGHSVFEHEASRERLADDVRAFVAGDERDGWARTAADRKLARFFREQREVDIARSPEMKSSLGIDEDQGKWTPVSDERRREDVELARSRLAELESLVDPGELSEAGRLNYRLYRHELETEVLGFEYRMNSYAFTRTPFDPYAARPQYLVSRHRIEDVGDAEDYIARMAGLADTLAQLREATAARAKRGIVLPAFNFEDISETSLEIASGRPCTDDDHDNRLWADFTGKVAALELPGEQARRLKDEASRVLEHVTCPAYREFAATVTRRGESVTRNDGIWATPDGDRYYRMAIELFTTRQLDPADIHRTGLEEVARIEGEIRELAREDGFEGTVNEYFAHLDERPGMLLPQTDAGRARYIETASSYIEDMYERLPRFFSELPETKVVAKAVEKEREAYQRGAFYVPAPLDGSEPATFWVNLAKMDEQPLWQLKSLTYHESVPGHHLQIALAREGADRPEFRKQYSNSAYTEGWALYAEALAKEMGAYGPGDPGNVGRLHFELRRAVRLVVDTGFHYKRWSIERSADYIREHLQTPPDSAMREMERYANWPGQALAYKLGQLEIERLRDEAREALGDDFDLREFHTVVLGGGVLPFDLLEERVDDWIRGLTD